MRRRKLMQGAIMFSTAAAVMISAVIMLLFVSAYILAQIGTLIAAARPSSSRKRKKPTRWVAPAVMNTAVRMPGRKRATNIMRLP